MKKAGRILFPVIFVLILFPIWGKMVFGRSHAKYIDGSEQQLNALFLSALKLDDSGASSGEINTPIDADGIIVALFSKDENDKSPIMAGGKAEGIGGETLIALIDEIGKKSQKIDDFTPGPLTLHLIIDASKVRFPFSKDIFSGYQSGLTGIMYCENHDCRALPAPLIHARGMSYDKAVKNLKNGAGALIDGLDKSDGIYLFKDFGILLGEKTRSLYRASVPLRNPSSKDIIDACRIAGDFLVRIQRSNGSWYYEYRADKDKLNSKSYNILRHAGTTYSLFQLYGVTEDKRYANSANRGLRYLEQSIEADPEDPKRLYVREGKNIKLGGAGLSLMAYVEKEKHSGTSDGEKKTMEGLARHLMLAQNADGSFESYHALPGKKAKKRRSIYYPGEAMVGLIRYYQIRPERKDCLDTVVKAANYLVDKRWNMLGLRFNIPPDAWLMLALEELHEVTGNDSYAQYCFDIAEGMGFDQWIGIYPQYDFYGGYFPVTPQVTPAGARSEGLTAAWLIAKRLDDRKMLEKLTNIIRRSASFQISCLIREPFSYLYANPQRALGVFRHSPVSNKTRIDYNQHNISGLLVAAKILDS